MCGFGGILNNRFAIYNKQVAEIASKVCHRGPNSCGISILDIDMQESDPGIHVLFFNRLAIIDLDKRSDQPFTDERYTLIFNGEIYNYRLIKQELEDKGVLFYTTSDTEVLFNALKLWGPSVIPRLNGMFAFSFIDRLEKKFIIARDRMGIKPLYYRQYYNSFIFASDLNTIIRLSEDQPVINKKALQMYLWMQFIPSPFTAFNDIYKLPPGQFIHGSINTLNQNTPLKPVAYWNAYVEVANRNCDVTPNEFEPILVNSLQRQLVADVPLGLFLSSGIDSSLLAALVNKYFANGQTFNFFTIAFTDQTKSDESKDAANFIKEFKNPYLVSDTLIIDPALLEGRLDLLYNFIDEPFGDPAVLLNWAISKKASEHVTVVLSGDGADELFWGYPRYKQWQQKILKMPYNVTLKGVVTTLASYVSPSSYYRTLASLFSENDKVKRHFNFFLHPPFSNLREAPVYHNPIWAMENVFNISNRNDLTAIMDIKTYLPDAMLYKVDRASMAASLEVRVPYLDNEVVDFALRLPFQFKSNSIFSHKAVLKSLLTQLAPHYNVNKPKKGFNFPLDQWLRKNWKQKALSIISKQALEDIGLDGQEYMKIVLNYYDGNKRNSIAVWYLLNLLLWKQKYDQTTSLKNETLSHYNY